MSIIMETLPTKKLIISDAQCSVGVFSTPLGLNVSRERWKTKEDALIGGVSIASGGSKCIKELQRSVLQCHTKATRFPSVAFNGTRTPALVCMNCALTLTYEKCIKGNFNAERRRTHKKRTKWKFIDPSGAVYVLNSHNIKSARNQPESSAGRMHF